MDNVGSLPQALQFTAETQMSDGIADPVEYAVAVDRYLAASGLSDQTRRIYRIALATWTWPLVERTAPIGEERRRATPPVVPLALLDDPSARSRLRAAATQRATTTHPRTLNRELSTLRSALGWWHSQGWLSSGSLAEVEFSPAPIPSHTQLSEKDLDSVLALRAPLRVQALWHFLHDTGAPIDRVLALDVVALDLGHRRTRPSAGIQLTWRSRTNHLLSFLLVSRTQGPVFLTDRQASATTPAADRCPLTGRGRLSYRRAAELFTAATRPLDPTGRGWTLRQLRLPEPGNTN
jgi:integrase/recombinase XerD